MTTVAEPTDVRNETPRPPALPLNVLFTSTILISALLLFAVQPMVSKMLLPPYGGAAAVWTTSLLFFQTVLLVGYAYAHFAPKWIKQHHPLVHCVLALLPLGVLPVALPAWAEPGNSVTVVGWLLLALAVMVGLPFVVLSTTGPLVQEWYSRLGLPRSHDPYFLYAASNIGSLVALVGYPFLVEPLLDVEIQSYWWAIAYGVFALLIIGCALTMWFRTREYTAARSDGVQSGQPSRDENPDAPAPVIPLTWRRRLRWLALAALPSSLMQGVTTFMTTDVAAMPLLWVLPLALYLSTFIIAFGVRRHGWVSGAVDVAIVASLPILLLAIAPNLVSVPAALLLSMAMLAAVALAAHGLLAADRPAPVHLTEFFLLVSLGGALGSLFNGVVAPFVFNQVLEYPIALAAVALLALAAREPSRIVQALALRRGARALRLVLLLVAGSVLALMQAAEMTWGLLLGASIVAVVILLLDQRPRVRAALFGAVGVIMLVVHIAPLSGSAEHHGRTFFGSYSVYVSGERRMLSHGTTVHGFQYLEPPERSKPVSYYSSTGPMGDIFAAYGDKANRLAVVGLGMGGIAAWGEEHHQFDFYEIDPEMVETAQNEEWFTYLHDCSCETNTMVGDGRLKLQEAEKGSYDIIVLDAFNSDAPPTHMLTTQALEEFSQRLSPDGVIVVNVSNRTLDLAPMVGATAKKAGLRGVARRDANFNESQQNKVNPDAFASRWVVLTRESDSMRPLTGASRPHQSEWRAVPTDGPVWTDSYSSLFGILRW